MTTLFGNGYLPISAQKMEGGEKFGVPQGVDNIVDAR